MSVVDNPSASFSSTQELLDINWCPSNMEISQDPSGLVDTKGPSLRSSGCPETEGPICPDVSPGTSKVSWSQTEASKETPTRLKEHCAEMDQLCGWGALKPKAIQVFNTPSWLLLFLCVASFLQGIIVNGFVNTVITSIERRFNLHSYQSGLIASSYDIAACICLPFVSYFGGRGHKPRWLGWGMLIMALGSLMFALPHFTTPPYEVSMLEDTGMCSSNRTSLCQDNQGGGMSNYWYVFILSQFLHGIGATPLYTLGVTYLDENVKSDNAPVCTGIFYAASLVGPAAGYLLGGYLLKFHTDIHLATDMTPENPLWVGAWWIGFLGTAAAALLVAFPILGYPHQLPDTQRVKQVSEAYQVTDRGHQASLDTQFCITVKDMLRSVLLLLKNPTFVFLCFAGAADSLLITAMSTFAPKFLEAQFSLNASYAASLFGYVLVPAGAVGILLGGFIVRKLKERCKTVIRFCVMCTVISLLVTTMLLIHCPNLPVAGVTAPYQSFVGEPPDQHKRMYDKPSKMDFLRSSMEGNLTADCNAGCSCVQKLYNPVCGADGVMYNSPCHAGCRSINHTEPLTGRQVYSGCSCVMGNDSLAKEGFALEGKCHSACSHKLLLLASLFIIIFTTFLCTIPALTATLRCVPANQTSFALGIQWIVMRVLGSIPGPIAFGSVIDTSCLLWQNQCGEQGSCYVYHNSSMSKLILGAGLTCKTLGVIFFLLASILYHSPAKSPQTEHSDRKAGDMSDNPAGGTSDLPISDLPGDTVIVNNYTKL